MICKQIVGNFIFKQAKVHLPGFKCCYLRLVIQFDNHLCARS